MHKLGKMVGLGAVALSAAACAVEGAERQVPEGVEHKASPLTLMAKPGSQVRDATEAGQDIVQLGKYTFYSANGDSNDPGAAEGSVHLFVSGEPVRTYRTDAGVPSARMGYRVGMSERWLVTDAHRVPVRPGEFNSVLFVAEKSGANFPSCGPIASDGTMPSCVTCTGSYNSQNVASSTMVCTPKPGMQFLEVSALSSSFSVNALEVQGSEILLLSGQKIVQFRHDGSAWNEITDFDLDPEDGMTFGPTMALSGNRLAVAGNEIDGLPHIAIYERGSEDDPWQFSLRLDTPNPSTGGFGTRVDLDGNSLVVTDYDDTYFFDLAPGSLAASPGSPVVQTCKLSGFQGDVAVSGSTAVLAQSGPHMPATFRRNVRWELQGGLPEGIFPLDVDDSGNSTAYSIWGAAVDGDRAALGWRNYVGENPATASGAAIGFSVRSQDCGVAYRDPNGVWTQAIPLEPVGAYGAQTAEHPLSALYDGSTATRWEYPKPAVGGLTLRLDFGQFETLQGLRIHWGPTYARIVGVTAIDTSGPTTGFTTLARVENGVGGEQYIDLSNAKSFGDHIVIALDAFASTPSTSENAVSIQEITIYGKTHELCSNKPQLECQGTAEHVCRTTCGTFNPQYDCFCDEACEYFGDCCSFDGAARGSKYYSGAHAVCSD